MSALPPGTLDYVRNNFFTTNGSVTQPQTKWSLKGDQYVRESDRVGFYFGWNESLETPGPNGAPRLPGFFSDYNDLESSQQGLPRDLGSQLQPDLPEPVSRRRQ